MWAKACGAALRVFRFGETQGKSRQRNRKNHSTRSSWLRGRDLNPRPSGYEPDELPGCSTPRLDAQYVDAFPRAQLKTRAHFQKSACRVRRDAQIGALFATRMIQSSSVVERSAVNRLVVGSNPTSGATVARAPARGDCSPP